MAAIWVDADATPVSVKEMLYRAAERTGITVTLVANQTLRVPRSRYIKTVQVAAGFDVADHYIVERVQAGDLVITADIPLAAEVVERDANALNPRGFLYTDANVRERLAVRDMLEAKRATGEMTGGPSEFSKRDRQNFANQLDRYLASCSR